MRVIGPVICFPLIDALLFSGANAMHTHSPEVVKRVTFYRNGDLWVKSFFALDNLGNIYRTIFPSSLSLKSAF